MRDTETTDDAAVTTPQASPGELLYQERELQGLSLEEVAAALNLRPAVIRGLEQDSYEEVPVAAYRRGYLRAYARLLGMDEQHVIALYKARFGKEESERKVIPVQVAKPPSRLGAWAFRLVTLLVIAGLVGLTLLWWQSRGGSQPPAPADSGPVAVDSLDGRTTITEDGRATDDVGRPAAETETPPAPDAPSPDGETATEASPTIAAEPEVPAEVAGEPAPEAAEATTAEATPEPAADPRVLNFTFNEQSWTEIFDADNQRIFVGLQEPGTTARVEGEPPFRLTVGNATGVELVWRGEVVDLGERAGANNVARFTLGE
ncbi:RodZ domain-containing protein [Halomonas cerina]|uniref:Cytoskeleton protein RodZ n=1 Tax=Halomonas cerina TaxID=447424 RepID=A0A839V7I9_9GAMM|nr:RodZ domain-containing protein [Halomonas cerina]MBB3191412.1 cytoskeleton protein RodZ [Halomonas cerina]